MDIHYFLQVGDISDNGQITIIDEDRLCYQVKSISRGAEGIRTISKALLNEFIQYYSEHPHANANQAREALTGSSDIDKFEYGYASTLIILAKMALDAQRKRQSISGQYKEINEPIQQIYYGAPGTGKSHAIEVATEGKDVIRTTFHPDSDYSTFVGAYKPTTKVIPVISTFGGKAVKVLDENGKEMTEERIVYEFVSQAFLQAYVGAWQKYAANGESPQPQFLVIEEINRGNCAQIFGDLFQLLDRNAAGFSEYPIKADADMKKQLKKLLNGLTINNAEAINAHYKGKDVVSQVLDGDVLLLPSNLFIWATMNTSDQSLFPIDSAFKRRWDWKYVRIDDARKGWRIQAKGKKYDWWDFLEKINRIIGDTTSSEDKKLGYFFCKTADGIISAETFVSKVVFYLWNDVFKDYEFEGDIFVDEDKTSKLSFDKFYITDAAGQTVVNEAKVDLFLTNLGVELWSGTPNSDEENPDDDNLDDDNLDDSTNLDDHNNLTIQHDTTKYRINHSDKTLSKRALAYEVLKFYVEQHPDMTTEDVLREWGDIKDKVGIYNFLETAEKHKSGSDDRQRRATKVEWPNGLLYISNQWSKHKIDIFINQVREKGWDIEIEEVEE